MERTVRFKTGHVTAANIDADSNALLQNFPVQTDMNANAVLWNCNVTIPRRAAVRTALSGLVRAQGYWGFAVNFDIMTFGMVDYWLDTFCATTNEYGLITAKVYNETNAAKYYQATLLKPDFQSLTQVAIGYLDVKWAFIYGVEIS